MTTPPNRVLVVEDDERIAQLVLDYLRHEGFAASAIRDGQLALADVQRSAPAAIVLDLMLPGLDGIEVCRAIRRFSDVPIVMVTARIDEIDRLLGLDSGADDYVCKPFSPRELVARVRALIRRAEGRLIKMPQRWQVDDDALRIARRGHWLMLTPLEFRMLRLLLSRPGRVFSRLQLLETVHGDSRDVSDRAIDTHVKNLRRKIQVIEPGFECIASVYGVGYRLDEVD